MRVTFGGGAGARARRVALERHGLGALPERARPTSTPAGVQVAPANVVIQFVDYAPTDVADQFGVPIPEAQLVGQGEVWILTGGGTQPHGVVKGTWRKQHLGSVTDYTDADGNPIQLTPGTHLGRAPAARRRPRSL